ncbi:MAG: glycogen synthase GlgA [Mariprofundales bacterium]|nr:glycogen synthase GlgA [Mariprofundales bacterium]
MSKILFIASEAAPLAKTGGLADVVGALPHALAELGHQVEVMIPFYRRSVVQAGVEVHQTDRVISIWIAGSLRHCPIHRARIGGVDFLLVEQDDLYDRAALYGEGGGAYGDNLLRFMVLDRVALEWAAGADAPFDLLHCHDWQSGLVPLLLTRQYRHRPALAHTRTIFTIHNLAYQGVFAGTGVVEMGLPIEDFHPEGYEFYHQINCMKAGVLAADWVTTVSPSYAAEILTAEYGCQLEGFLRRFSDKLSGVVNGLDMVSWNPATDPHTAANFAAGHATGKKRCKRALQESSGLASDDATPLLVTISRLADQKGIDLLVDAAPLWFARGVELVVLGSGDAWLEERLRQLEGAYPKQCRFYQGFNEPLARQIYAGADFFVMPSRFEPCGLGQLMAMRYGAIPIVRATGGLIDTVIDVADDGQRATGFHFADASSAALAQAGVAAIEYRQASRAAFSRMIGRALRRDSSWRASAVRYSEIYGQLGA